MKKVFAILLALTMLLAMAAPAMAETGSITIKNPVEGQTYSIYRIFNLESYDNAIQAYTYKVNSDWNNFFVADAKGLDYVEIDGQGYVTWKDGANVEAFAKAALEFAQTNTVAAVYTKTATADEATGAVTVQFTGLTLGYYLVDTTLGTLCGLNTTKPDVEIEEKNSQPGFSESNAKQVKEDSTGLYGASNTADRGQVVEYKVTFKAKKGAQNYVLHDLMDSNLSFNAASVAITRDDAPVVNTDTVTYYEVKSGSETPTPCTFEIAFTDTFADSITGDTEVVVTYTATLSGSAPLKENIQNKAWMTFGEGTESTESVTNTQTFSIPVFKYTLGADDETKIGLSGAQFALYKEKMVDDEAVVEFYKKNNDGTVSWVASDYTVIETPIDIAETEVNEAGLISFDGVDAGTYYLIEVKQPDGYNKLPGEIVVEVDENGNVYVDSSMVSQVEVLNNAGSELPATGGIGTTIFYVVGGLLMAAAVVLLVTKKKVASGK